ncbi:histidine phosphatase super family protein [Burkholderia cenocepacia]|uniref:Histidine phosphatase super family protein n=1 Tax=Burkholderia cenocepacia TaxID=95486 RepID=A0AAN0VQH9_9BURK|nr:histidine phosphatase super family protein [Burkholderia cenocepacia]
MPALLRLIAHASTRAMRTGTFPDDDPLDARGLAEAAAHRERRAGIADARVLCSPARCARQTADALGLHPDIDAMLREVDYGRWRGRRLQDLGRDCPNELRAWIRDPSASPHGGESFDEAMRRAGAWLNRLPHERDIVAITHATVVRAVIANVLRADARTVSGIDIAPLSCTTFARTPEGWMPIADDDRRDRRPR